jgi:hypothetical protein
MTNTEVRYEFMKYFIEKEYSSYGCHADDFLSDKNKVVLADDSDEDFYSMKCFTNAAVVKAKKDIYEWSKRFVSKHIGFRCFDFTQATALCRELLKYNMALSGGQGFLPDMTIKRVAPEIDFSVKIFNQDEKVKLNNYIDKNEWHMDDPIEEDSVLIVAAFDKDKIVGWSYAENDTDILYSIGVEVLPQYRNKGIAISLTVEITNILLSKGIIPFATGAWSNNASRSTLCKCGYYTAWSSLESCNGEWAMKILNATNEYNKH